MSHFRLCCPSEADHSNFLVATDENHDAEARAAPADRNFPRFAIILSIIDMDQSRLEVKVDDVPEIQAMLGKIAAALRLIPSDHRKNPIPDRRAIRDFM